MPYPIMHTPAHIPLRWGKQEQVFLKGDMQATPTKNPKNPPQKRVKVERASIKDARSTETANPQMPIKHKVFILKQDWKDSLNRMQSYIVRISPKVQVIIMVGQLMLTSTTLMLGSVVQYMCEAMYGVIVPKVYIAPKTVWIMQPETNDRICFCLKLTITPTYIFRFIINKNTRSAYKTGLEIVLGQGRAWGLTVLFEYEQDQSMTMNQIIRAMTSMMRATAQTALCSNRRFPTTVLEVS